MKFSGKLRFPSTLQNINISNCGSVDWEQLTESFQLNLQQVSIQNVGFLTISPSALKKVSNLIISNVTGLTFEDNALSALEADNVLFRNVHFNDEHIIRPLIIKSKLEFQSANFTNGLTVEMNQETVSGLTVSFRKCEFMQLPKSKIKADHIEFIENNYNNIRSCDTYVSSECEFNSQSKGKTILEFGKSLDIKGNTLNAHQQLPDVRSSQQNNGEIDISLPEGIQQADKIPYSIIEIWLMHFDLNGNKTNKSPRGPVEQCKEKVVWDSKPPENRIICPSPNSLLDYVRKNQLRTIYDRFPKPTTIKKPTSSSSFIFPMVSLLFITCAPVWFPLFSM